MQGKTRVRLIARGSEVFDRLNARGEQMQEHVVEHSGLDGHRHVNRLATRRSDSKKGDRGVYKNCREITNK